MLFPNKKLFNPIQSLQFYYTSSNYNLHLHSQIKKKWQSIFVIEEECSPFLPALYIIVPELVHKDWFIVALVLSKLAQREPCNNKSELFVQTCSLYITCIWTCKNINFHLFRQVLQYLNFSIQLQIIMALVCTYNKGIMERTNLCIHHLT